MELPSQRSTPAQSCWGCQTPCDDPHHCGTCGVILPNPRSLDHFEVLQIPKQYVVNSADLRKAYLDLSRRFHPDRFGQRSVKERRLAVEKSASINTAYKTLLDPVKRAEYLLSQEAGFTNLEKLRADPEVLEAVLEKREQIAELRDAPREVAVKQLNQILEEAKQKEAQLLSSLDSLFSRFDQGDATVPKEVERIIVLYRYNRGILQETSALLAVLDGVS
jgi:molecular chaperone HscB